MRNVASENHICIYHRVQTDTKGSFVN